MQATAVCNPESAFHSRYHCLRAGFAGMLSYTYLTLITASHFLSYGSRPPSTFADLSDCGRNILLAGHLAASDIPGPHKGLYGP